ncbi:hypothetical protein ABT061_41585 [Streptosporangium sp. NPDC002544]|uniref:hypothetical protein n=1 Tax=Streptosporangium sp. NPDC002544 TaxID=3154538 RepID=UPI0033318D53
MDRYAELVPQMAQYEKYAKGGIPWLPYIMYFNALNYSSPVINTDSGGFRISRSGMKRYSLQENLPPGPVSLVMGGSSAFGFGATCDQKTLASLLSENNTGTPWLNLAAPAFNSTQEVVLFLLNRHLLPEVRDIVVYGGLNNLVVAGLPGAAENYGQFFFSGEFFGHFNGQEVARTDVSHIPGRDSTSQNPLSRIARLLRPQSKKAEDAPSGPSAEERVEIATRLLLKDLDRLLELAEPTGARVHFVLQPTLSWTGKKRSAEEAALLEDDTGMWAQMWAGFQPVFAEAVYTEHAQRVEEICKTRGVSFLDMNKSLLLSVNSDDWLFVDPVHLNDTGTEAVSEILKREFNLH